MKRIILICSLLVVGLIGFGQSEVPRSNGLNTLIDPRLDITKNLYIPKYTDTTQANLVANLGIDSSSAIIFTRSPQAMWMRAYDPKRWVQVSSLNSVSNISIVDDSTIQICYSSGNCTNVHIVTNITNINTVSFIDNSHIQVCSVDTVGGTPTSVCDTINIGAQSINYLAGNWLRLTSPSTFEFGSDQPYTSEGLFLSHNTYANTGYYGMYWDGYKIYDAPHQFSQQQSFQNGSGIVSFKSAGNDLIGQPNSTRLIINYSSDTLDRSPFREGYFGRAIGYSIGTNWTGHSVYGVYLDDNNAKTTGIFFHQYDSTTTDGVTIYAAPDLGGTAPIFNGLLKNYRAQGWKTDLSTQLYGYGSTSSFLSSDTTNKKPLGVDANGNLYRMNYWFGGGGSSDSSVFATHWYVDSTINTINLVTSNIGSGLPISFDRGDTLYLKSLKAGVFTTVTTINDSANVVGLDTASTALHTFINNYSNSAWQLPYAGVNGNGVDLIWLDTVHHRIRYTDTTNHFNYGIAIADSIDATVYDPDAQTYIDAVNATDVTLTGTQKTAINSYVVGLKADTLWTKVYDQGIPIWGTAASSAVMLKGTHTVTWVNSPTFSSDGVVGNGTTQYGNLNFTPTTAYSSQDDGHLGIYVQTNVTDAGIDLGVATTGSPNKITYINTKSGSTNTGHINDATNIGGTVASSAGFTLLSRTGSATLNFYKDGSFIGDGGTTSTGLATHNFFLMAYNQAGTPGNYSTRKISLWTIGSALTSSNASKLATRVNTFMTALGINVY